MRLNRRVPNGTHGGVRGRGSFSPSYSIARPVSWGGLLVYRGNPNPYITKGHSISTFSIAFPWHARRPACPADAPASSVGSAPGCPAPSGSSAILFDRVCVFRAASTYSKVFATSSRYCRMGRCWGHISSHWPHLMQSLALPFLSVRRL